MRTATILVPMAMLALAACGPNNGAGFYATGQLEVSVTSQGTPTRTGFNFDAAAMGGQVRVDPMLPSGASTGFTGTCNVGPTGRSIQITRVGGDAVGLRSFTINLNPWADDTCTNCQHGTISVALGDANSAAVATFSGAESRGGNGPSRCTFNATRSGSYGMQITTQCTGLTAQGDMRTIDVNGTFAVQDCDGPESRNP